MSYSRLVFVFLPALLCSSVAFGQGAPKSAHADIVNAQGQSIGTAKILPAKKGVKIEVNVSQLPPGNHGIHIHAVGKCGANSLFHDGGTAIVIHEKEDDYKTDPTGNSGGRIACGVIQK